LVAEATASAEEVHTKTSLDHFGEGRLTVEELMDNYFMRDVPLLMTNPFNPPYKTMLYSDIEAILVIGLHMGSRCTGHARTVCALCDNEPLCS
jgi:hypothetical protein